MEPEAHTTLIPACQVPPATVIEQTGVIQRGSHLGIQNSFQCMTI